MVREISNIDQNPFKSLIRQQTQCCIVMPIYIYCAKTFFFLSSNNIVLNSKQKI